MSQEFKRILTAGIAAAAILSGIAGAQAGAFAIREQSAEDLGDAFAGAATSGSSLSSMFWNPATMTSHKGWQSTSAFSAILPYASIQSLNAISARPPNSGNIGESALVPASSTSYQINDNLWAGLSINSPFGLSTKAQVPWNGGVYGQSSDARSINIRPTLAYKINEMFSIGFGLDIERFSLHLTNLDPKSPTTVDDLKGSSWGIGATAGVTIKPAAGTEIGIGYRSQIRQNIHGSLSVANGLGGVFNVKSNVTLPDQINIGLRQKITDQFTGLAGFEWTHWSVFNKFPVVGTSGPTTGVTITNLGFKYRNGWFASLGGEYKATPNMTLRAGLAYEHSPISDVVRGVRLPDNNRIWTTAGLSYAIDKKLSFDLSYAHIFPAKTNIAITSASNPSFLAPGLALSATVKSHIDIVSVGLNYRWDDPKEMEAVPAQKAIVRKY